MMPTNARVTALVLWQIDATILSYPDIQVARKHGMNVLADVGDFSAYPNMSLLVNGHSPKSSGRW